MDRFPHRIPLPLSNNLLQSNRLLIVSGASCRIRLKSSQPPSRCLSSLLKKRSPRRGRVLSNAELGTGDVTSRLSLRRRDLIRASPSAI